MKLFLILFFVSFFSFCEENVPSQNKKSLLRGVEDLNSEYLNNKKNIELELINKNIKIEELKLKYSSSSVETYFSDFDKCKKNSIECSYLKSIFNEKNIQYRDYLFSNFSLEEIHRKYFIDCERSLKKCFIFKKVKTEVENKQADLYLNNILKLNLHLSECKSKIKILNKIGDAVNRRKLQSSFKCKTSKLAKSKLRRKIK